MFEKKEKVLQKFIIAAAILFAGLVPAAIRAQATGGIKAAVIDSDRIVAESIRGKQALATLKKKQDEKMAEGRKLQGELDDLRKRLDAGKMSLAPEKLDDLQKQYEDKVIAMRRFKDDADRELGKLRDEALGKIEKDVLQIIDTIGKEGNYTMIFNKYRSGLVYADDSIDITDQVIQRFDAASKGAGGSGK